MNQDFLFAFISDLIIKNLHEMKRLFLQNNSTKSKTQIALEEEVEYWKKQHGLAANLSVLEGVFSYNYNKPDGFISKLLKAHQKLEKYLSSERESTTPALEALVTEESAAESDSESEFSTQIEELETSSENGREGESVSESDDEIPELIPILWVLLCVD